MDLSHIPAWHGADLSRIERDRWVRRPFHSLLFASPGRHRTLRGPSGGTYETGLAGEEFVARQLGTRGWTVLGRRVRTRSGELDIVARRGQTIVFAEVKTAGPRRLEVERSVTPRSRHRIRRAAVTWMATNPSLQTGVRHYRFDVFIVHRDAAGAVLRVEHIQHAF